MGDLFDATDRPETIYDEERGVYRAPYADEGRNVMTDVVLTVAEIDGVDPTLLPPAAETIDPDTVDRFVRERDAGRIPYCELSFDIYGFSVTIADGTLVLDRGSYA